MSEKKYFNFKYSDKKIENKEPKDWNKVLVDTSGFVPLKVRFAQLEQQGYIAKFQHSDFDSADISELWLSEKFAILPSDEEEQIVEKLKARAKYKEYLLNLRQSENTVNKNEELNNETKQTREDVKE